MSEKTEKHILLGQALMRLRKKAGLTQYEAAERHGSTPASWGRYEKGERKALLKEDIQDEVMSALGLTRNDLEAEVADVLAGRSMFESKPRPPQTSIPSMGAPGIGSAGFGFYEAPEGDDIDLAAMLDGNSRGMRIINEDIVPYVEPGGFVIYNIKKIPRRHQGVVIKMRGGPYIARFYLRSTASQIHVVRIESSVEQGETNYKEVVEFISTHETEGVYPIILRGE